MHDRAARLTGPVKSAAAMVIETMILLNIDLRIAQVRPRVERSEEHTSELQSQSNLVCRLLLEKKKESILPGLPHEPELLPEFELVVVDVALRNLASFHLVQDRHSQLNPMPGEPDDPDALHW